MPITNNVFQLNFPDGWRETTTYTFEGPFDSGVQHNLVLVVDPKVDNKTQVAVYAKQQMATSKEALPGFELLSEKERTLASGIHAYEIAYRYSPSDNISLYQKQMYMILDGKGYVFTSTFSKKTLQTIADDVDKIIATFRPIKME